MMTDLEREYLQAKQAGTIPVGTGWAEWKMQKAEQRMNDMTSDTMRIDAPAAELELALLRTMKVGEVRRGELIPALPLDMEWTCTRIGLGAHMAEGSVGLVEMLPGLVPEPVHWEFEGTFCGVLLMRVSIDASESALTLMVTVEE